MLPDRLYDTFGRKHDYLRISLTDACNLRCRYCMPDEKVMTTASAKLMQVDEILGIAGVFVNLGVKKIRLTGGEPLVRLDAARIMEGLADLPVELAVSTNGVLVHKFVGVFKRTGIRSVNVSLDTLNAEEFLAITQRGEFNKIVENIQLLLANDFKVRLNMVVVRGVNEHVLLDFIAWTKDFPLEVRFIEFMPFAGNAWERSKVFSYAEMLALIAAGNALEKLTDAPSDTAKKYKVKGHVGTFAFITTVTEPFCGGCNRLRLTADGKMKNCLFSQGEVDLLGPWRRGEIIEQLIMDCVLGKKKELGGRKDFEKPAKSGFLSTGKTTDEDANNIENRSMIRIGG